MLVQKTPHGNPAVERLTQRYKTTLTGIPGSLLGQRVKEMNTKKTAK